MKTDQDFEVIAGRDANPVVTVKDSADAIINIGTVTEIKFVARKPEDDSIVLTKTKSGGGIAFVTDGSDGKFKIILNPADTENLSGYYIYEVDITDSAGDISPIIRRSYMRVGVKPNWTYSGDPATSSRDRVRSLIGDTDSSAQQIMDAEIDRELTVFPNAYLAASSCARKLATKFMRKGNKRVGDLAIDYGNIAQSYRDMAKDLEAIGHTRDLVPYSGGISEADRETVTEDTDRVPPVFIEGQFDNPQKDTVVDPDFSG